MGWASRLRLVKGAEGQADAGSVAAHPGRREAERCGLCGKKKKLRRTECCGQLICDDSSDYEMFSYARNSCSRNHSRYTVCGHHHAEKHKGAWQTCAKCRKEWELEMYVYYGTNEYNFEKLQNPPAYEPTRCSGCGRVISLGRDGHTSYPDGSYRCDDCFED